MESAFRSLCQHRVFARGARPIHILSAAGSWSMRCPLPSSGTRIYPTQTITLAKAAQTRQNDSVTILLNKPIGFVSGQAEQGYRPAITLITAESQFKADRSPITFNRKHLANLAPAGRLDIDSTGLLVLTQDGRVAKQLIGNDSALDKEYLVRVEGTLSAHGLNRTEFRLEP